MRLAARAAYAGNKILSAAAVMLILLLFTYGGYSLWDVHRVYAGALVSDELLKFKPGDGDNELSFEQLRAINPDVKAWITVDGTHIDYPVVQGKDDMEYVNKNVKGEFALSGAIFMTSKNRPDFSDRYNLTYGHHMENGAMYGDVMKMLGKDFFDKHKTGKLYTEKKVYKIEFYAAMECDAYDSQIYNAAAIQSDIDGLQSYAKQRSSNFRNVELGSDDQVICLSTCTNTSTNGRAALLGKLTEIKEGS